MSLKILATDLDRTLFPNGNQPATRGAMERFTEWVVGRPFELVYNTGRSKKQILEGIRQFSAPEPDLMIAEVGTRIYERSPSGDYRENTAWVKALNEANPTWDAVGITDFVLGHPGTLRQEAHNQNSHKCSFYLEPEIGAADRAKELTASLRERFADLAVVFSIDETEGVALFDVLPAAATKVNALEFLRREWQLNKDEVFFSGDSGNDLAALANGYRSVLVRNAIPAVQEEARRLVAQGGWEETFYIAQGGTQWGNGYYVSGMLEGLAHFGFLPAAEPA